MKLFIILITSLIVLLLLFLVILPLTVHWPFKMGGKENFNNNKNYLISIATGNNKYIKFIEPFLDSFYKTTPNSDIKIIIVCVLFTNKQLETLKQKYKNVQFETYERPEPNIKKIGDALMVSRPKMLLDIAKQLKIGSRVIYTDIDHIFQKNLTPFFNEIVPYDIGLRERKGHQWAGGAYYICSK